MDGYCEMICNILKTNPVMCIFVDMLLDLLSS